MSSRSTLRAALEAIHAARASADTVALTTPKILRQLLGRDHGLSWTPSEWNAERSTVLHVWNQILEDNREELATSSPQVEPAVAGPIKNPAASSTSRTLKKKRKSDANANEIVLSSDHDVEHAHKVAEDESEEGEETVDVKPRKTKYDRIAAKNLGNFLDMALGSVMGDLLGGGGNDDGSVDDDDDGGQAGELTIDDSSSVNCETPPPVAPKPQPKPRSRPTDGSKAKKPRNSASTASTTKTTTTSTAAKKGQAKAKGKEKESYKSTEFVHDSDDSSNEVVAAATVATGASEGKGRKRRSVVVDSEQEDSDGEPLTGKGKGKAKDRGGKGSEVKKVRTRKEPARKDGDADKGTEAEEERIKKLKNLLKLAGTPRPFTAQTGAERTLPVQTRLSVLSTLLDELGLKALQGTSTKASGLRTGKIRKRPGDNNDDDDDDDDEDDQDTEHKTTKRKGGSIVSPGGGGHGVGMGTSQRKKLEARKRFASFLGDQSDSD
ncbi:hypothetical protein JCM11491_004659 [Sporobolomyces phaffii]